MGTDRYLVATTDIAKGEVVAGLYRAHNYEDPKTRYELILDMVRIAFDEFGSQQDVDQFFEDCEKWAACRLLDTIIEDGCVEAVDK